jgi:hypothetical protein
LKHYSQQPSYGNNQDVPLLINGSRNVVLVHNGILLSYEEE